MNTFKVTAKREDEYDIQIDPEYWNEDMLNEYSKTFHQVDDVEDIAKEVAACFLRQGRGEYYEGFGYIKTIAYNNLHEEYMECKPFVGKSEELKYCPGIVVTILSYDMDYEYESEEI